MANVLVTNANYDAVKASVNQLSPGNKLVIVVGSTVPFQLPTAAERLAGIPPRVLSVSTPLNTVNNTKPAPSGSTKSSIKTSDVLKAAVLVEGGIALFNTLTNNSTTTPSTTSNQITTSTAGPEIVQNASPSPTTAANNPAADAAFLEANASEQQVIDPNSDPNTNIGNDSQEQPPEPQQTITLASDPNTNIGAEGQDFTGFEPLTEPPPT